MIRIVETAHGRMMLDDREKWIAGSLLHLGEYNFAEEYCLHKYVVPGTVVVDAGANLGAVAVPLAHAVGPRGVVVAVEPQRSVYGLLEGNVALNSLRNVECHRAALGDSLGMVLVRDMLAVDPDANTGGLDIREPADDGIPTPVVTVDSLVAGRPCSLLKIDVEGMEPDVILGSVETIARCKPVVYLEVDRASWRESCALLLSAGYRIWSHHPPLYRSANFNEAEHPWGGGNYVSVNAIALHPSTHPDKPTVANLRGEITQNEVDKDA